MIIAHDLGTTGDKASLHENDGALVGAVTVAYPTRFADGGVAEQDPHDWYWAVVTATKQLVDRHRPGSVDVIGMSGQMMGAVFLGADHEPVGPAMIWADTRAGQQTARLIEAIGADRGYRLTGHRFNPGYTLPKIMWLADHHPDLFARVRHVCLAKDFVAQRLTGRLATDPSDASGTNAFDLTTWQWSAEILSAANLPADLLPEVVPSATPIGPLTAAPAAEMGLPAGIPVVIGGGDGPLAAMGLGITEPADGAYVYLGSSSWVSLATPAPIYDADRRTMTFTHVLPDRYVPTATMQAGGGSLQWIAEVLAPTPEAREFDRLVDAAATAHASAQGLYFLPHLLGERSPYWNPDARGAFLGLARHHGRAEMTRAVLEGVAFNLLTCVTAFRESGAAIDRMDAIGGGAKSDAWLQIMADMWGVPVRRRNVVDEANSLGAAVVAGLGVGLIEDPARAAALSEITAEFTPDPARHDAYTARYPHFMDAYQRLESWFTPRQDTP